MYGLNSHEENIINVKHNIKGLSMTQEMHDTNATETAKLIQKLEAE